MKKIEKTKTDWEELVDWVEKNIFDYDNNQHLQKEAILRLRGVQNGKVIANNKTKNNGNYSAYVILLTFKAYKNVILNSIKDKEFNSEGMKMAYICAIVRSHINEIYEKVADIEKTDKAIERTDTTIANYKGIEYASKKDKQHEGFKRTDKYDELW